MIRVEDIAGKRFKKSLIGYDLEQVDRYLDEIIALLNAMEKERREMVQTIEYLEGELAAADTGIHRLPNDPVVLPISPHNPDGDA